MERSILTILCAFLALINFGLIFAEESKTFKISSPLGKIRGSYLTSRLGKRIYAFRGIRYAQAPVGQLRFQSPVPVKPWSNVLDASVEGPACPQPWLNFTSEDCLRLNVYATKLPLEEKVKRPVLVFFHPGGYYSRSGQTQFHGPEYLLDQDIVLVTVNYRLASLGFMSTGDSHMPGNLGLKDQVTALRWVKNNIASFGGDPGCVTIAGSSAGSWSVSVHLVSPMSKGLFHRAIGQSGSATYQTPLPRHQKDLVIQQAQLLNCPTNSVKNMVDCLKAKPVEDFTNTVLNFFDNMEDPILVWVPVIEPVVPGVERFLTGQPTDLIRQGKFEHVPFIGGVTKDEFGGNIIVPVEEAKKGNYSLFDNWNTNWEHVAPISFLYERDTPRSKQISHALRKFYFNDEPVTLKNIKGIAHLYCDGVIAFATHRLINILASASTKPVYYYNFIFQGRYSHKVWPETKKPYGVVHHDDLMYLFNIKQFPFFKKGDPELPTVEKMTAMWAHFAKTGEPIPKNNQLFKNVTWEKFTPQHKRYLEINTKLTMRNSLILGNRMQFWDKLFPLPPLKSHY